MFILVARQVHFYKNLLGWFGYTPKLTALKQGLSLLPLLAGSSGVLLPPSGRRPLLSVWVLLMAHCIGRKPGLLVYFLMRLCPLMINLCLLLQLQTFLIFCLPMCLFSQTHLCYLVLFKLLKFYYTFLLLLLFKQTSLFPFLFPPLPFPSFPSPFLPWVLHSVSLFGSHILLPVSEQLNANIAKETS